MSDRPSRALLAATAAAVAFAAGAYALAAPTGDPAPAPSPSLPAFALAPAIPADAELTGAGRPTRPPNDAPAVTVALAGDVHGEPPIADLLAAGDDPFAGVADVLGAADLAVVNLETAVGTAGSPADKAYTFQADPALLDALAGAGVDVVSMANNHALDFGHDGAEETLALAEDAGLVVVGYGRDRVDAYTGHVVDVGGRTVAVVGLTRVMPWIEWAAGADRPGMASAYDRHLDLALQAVRDAAAVADHVVVAIHWGRERHTCPDEAQLSLARALVAAGADVVAGHHPHVLQGVVELDDALVAYSLGNFAFYARTPATRQTGVLTVTLGPDGLQGWDWTPATIDAQGRPQVVATQAPVPEDDLITTTVGPQCGPPTTG